MSKYTDEETKSIRAELESLYFSYDKNLQNNKAVAIIKEAAQKGIHPNIIIAAIRKIKSSDQPFMTKDIFKKIAQITIPDDDRSECVYCNKYGAVTCIDNKGQDYEIACVCENKRKHLAPYSELNHNVKYPINDFKLSDKESAVYERLRQSQELRSEIKKAGFEV